MLENVLETVLEPLHNEVGSVHLAAQHQLVDLLSFPVVLQQHLVVRLQLPTSTPLARLPFETAHRWQADRVILRSLLALPPPLFHFRPLEGRLEEDVFLPEGPVLEDLLVHEGSDPTEFQ